MSIEDTLPNASINRWANKDPSTSCRKHVRKHAEFGEAEWQMVIVLRFLPKQVQLRFGYTNSYNWPFVSIVKSIFDFNYRLIFLEIWNFGLGGSAIAAVNWSCSKTFLWVFDSCCFLNAYQIQYQLRKCGRRKISRKMSKSRLIFRQVSSEKYFLSSLTTSYDAK